MNSYGHFDDENKQYVITRPDTPLPWINYLGSNEFYGLISNTAGGYTFYKDARLRRLTRYRYNNVPVDSNGRYIYVKDGDALWNPMWKPMKVALDYYECRHGAGHTIIRGIKNELGVDVTFFIPIEDNVEIWDIKIRNMSEIHKSIRLWGFVEWCLWDAWDDQTNFQRNFSIGQVEVENNTIFHKTEYRERRNHFAYFSSSIPTSGFDSSRDAFVGVHSGLHEPKAVLAGASTNSLAYGWAPIAAHQIDLELAPGEERRFHFTLGYAENDKDKKFIKQHVINKRPFKIVKDKYASSAAIDQAFAALKDEWDRLFSIYKTHTPDDHVNRMVNMWNQYQCMVTFNMSRSASFYESGIGRGMGYRDSNQDVLGFVHMIPQRARERILDIAATQLSDGTCYHQYQPLTKQGNTNTGSGFNDDPLWLILSTAAYVKETGDLSILDEKIGFADLKDRKATLMDHLNISIEYTIHHRGPHQLPLIGHADWNDCLNLNCFSDTPGESFQLAGDAEGGDTAESVMIAGLFCAACLELKDIYTFMNLPDHAKKVAAYYKEMSKAILEHGWDGDWFLRAYDAYGKKIGSKECAEGKIFIESQGWCSLGHVGAGENYPVKALNSVAQHLATKNGIILQQPAYQHYHLELGEISSYPPGYKENAGIFTHNNTWIQIAETLVGNGDRAFDYYLSICPSKKEEQIDIYRAEPYVYSQMTAGRDAPTPGEGKNSWLTGTASWSFVAISQYILGIKPELDGLEINPCIPKEWKEFSVTRQFRGTTFFIHVSNPHGVSKGVKSIRCAGREIAGSRIPLMPGVDKVQVHVILG
ncbi:glycosyl transferase [candidate division KSB1 bacterium]|nr:glycosyl transferase [candidate division KSB1 bacterium]RQW00701.1 MAG: glycosyl transferase [candidate division KSB1 bacterium]